MTDERRRVSRRHERDTAKRFGAQVHKGSGSGSKRNDSHTSDALIENKTVLPGKRQITIKVDDLKQLQREAALQGRFPRLHIRVGEEEWVLVREIDFLDLLAQ